MMPSWILDKENGYNSETPRAIATKVGGRVNLDPG